MSEIIEGKPQLSPGVCFICELSNPVKYWDTYRDFYGVVRESLDGRKYVCEECIAQGAKLFGFVTPKDYTALSDERKELQNEVNRLRQENESLKQLKELAQFFAERPSDPMDVPKKAPTRKTAAKA